MSFAFEPNLAASPYDQWRHYREKLERRGWKAVDMVAVRITTVPPDCWLIEVKDFRVLRGEPKEENQPSHLPGQVYRKAVDSLAGLQDAAKQAEETSEREHASLAMRATRMRVVLHLELPSEPSRLFPRVPNPASVKQKLAQLIRELPCGLHAQPLVRSIANGPAGVPWTVSSP